MLVCFLGSIACTQTNPNLCCVDEADCSSHGIAPGSTCGDGLVCRGNQCIAETCTTSANCEAAAPYCLASQLCGAACDDNAECPGFGQSTTDRFCSNGACVECLASTDCPTDHPVCDANACRGCALDSECASHACGDNGACIDESSVVYIDTAGADSGTCTKSTPCLTIGFAITQVTSTRSHLALAAGTYVEAAPYLMSSNVAATTLTIHGNGATLKKPSVGENGPLSAFDIGLRVRDLTLVGDASAAALIQTGTVPCSVDHVVFSTATKGIELGGPSIEVHNSELVNVALGVHVSYAGAALKLDRVSFRGGQRAVQSDSAAFGIDASNVVVTDATGPMDLSLASGTIQFSTFGDTAGSGFALLCAASVTLDSSILWNPGGKTISGPCLIRTSIAGPTSVAGAMNMDPLFIDELHRDFHLGAGSPAIDVVDSGPALDRDGVSRPQGARFDLGAFEAH